VCVLVLGLEKGTDDHPVCVCVYVCVGGGGVVTKPKPRRIRLRRSAHVALFRALAAPKARSG
jgi:hypothetical protein